MSKSQEDLLYEYRDAQKKDGPAERWRKPVIPIAVEDDPHTITHDGNVLRSGYNATFDEETIERFRVGRVCMRCWEPQEEAFPEHCGLCKYPMGELQARDFEREFEGEKWIGPRTTLADEYERMLENGKRKRHTPGGQILTSSGILLPPGVTDS